MSSEKTTVIHWYTCNCDWWTKYCDEYHRRTLRISNEVLDGLWAQEMVRLNAAEALRKNLDPQPWLFISDQIFGEIRWHEDKGYHDVSGTWWAFKPRPEFEQDQAFYSTKGETNAE